jgi:hypothetical protein
LNGPSTGYDRGTASTRIAITLGLACGVLGQPRLPAATEQLMDPFRFCLALLPLAVYLLVLGGLQLSRRPLLVTGARDLVALGLGLSGIMLIGPIELSMSGRW